jgi:hypothetical protein
VIVIRREDILSDEEIAKIVKMPWSERERWYPNIKELERIGKTIEAIEAELKSAKGLKRFIKPGVLVTDRLVLGAEPTEWTANLFLRAFGDHEGQVNVPLTIEEAERLAKLLPEAIKASRKQMYVLKLKEILKEKQQTRRYW